MRRGKILEWHLQQRGKALEREFQIAVHRVAIEEQEIRELINSVAVKVGQLCSIDGDYAQVEFPFTKLLTSHEDEDIFKCDLLSRKFDKITAPGFSFIDH